jgi:hypothetical protein
MHTSKLSFLDNADAAERQIAQLDWAGHPLGPIAAWAPALRTALGIMLSSGFPSYVAWTDRLHTFYNAPYQELMTGRSGAVQGASMGDLWPEVAEAVVSICSQAFAGKSMFFEDMSLPGMGTRDRFISRFRSVPFVTSKASFVGSSVPSLKRPRRFSRWPGTGMRTSVIDCHWKLVA